MCVGEMIEGRVMIAVSIKAVHLNAALLAPGRATGKQAHSQCHFVHIHVSVAGMQSSPPVSVDNKSPTKSVVTQHTLDTTPSSHKRH